MPVALSFFPLLVLLAFAVTLGLQKGWAASFQQLFYWLAEQIDKLPSVTVLRHTIGFGGVAHAIRAASDSVYNWLGQAVQHTSAPWVAFTHYMADVLTKPAQQVALAVADVLHTLTVLRTQIIPRMIAAKVAWIPAHLARLSAEVASLAARAPVHIVKQIEHTTANTTKVIVNKAVALPWPRIGHLEREAGTLGKRIDRLAKRVAPAALAAAVVATIARTSWRWVRCAKVRKVGRATCGMDDGLLDSLLADTLVIVGTVSLIDFARGMQDATDEVAGAVRAFWRA